MTDWIGFAESPSKREPVVASAGQRLDSGARARIARDWLRRRRHREHFFPAGIFADPAWDMLLDLYAAHYEGQVVTVSSLCIAGSVPSTTALRRIKRMCDQGLFVRTVDRDDRRRAFIHLSERMISQLDAYFDSVFN